jgi:phage-related minor tail protein
VATIKPAIQALKSVVPQISDLINKLIDLMGKLKTEINNLNPGAVPGLDKVSKFTTGITNLLTTAKNLLPNEAASIDDVLAVTNVVSSLPSLDAVKAEVIALIDAIVADLNQLK